MFVKVLLNVAGQTSDNVLYMNCTGYSGIVTSFVKIVFLFICLFWSAVSHIGLFLSLYLSNVMLKWNASQSVEEQGMIVLSTKYFLYGVYLESLLYVSSLASEPRM